MLGELRVTVGGDTLRRGAEDDWEGILLGEMVEVRGVERLLCGARDTDGALEGVRETEGLEFEERLDTEGEEDLGDV